MCRVDSGFKLFVCGLRHSSDKVVCSRIVEIDPLGGFGFDELVVDKVGSVGGTGDLFMCCGIVKCRGSGSGWGELLGSGMESPFGY